MKKLTRDMLKVVHGNLNFALSFFLGKTLLVAARAFAHVTTDGQKATGEQIRELCAWTHAMVGTLSPKKVDPGGEATPVLVFTDAAYEDGIATWGIVIVDPVSQFRTALGGNAHGFLLFVLHVYVYGATVASVVVLCGRCGCLCPC